MATDTNLNQLIINKLTQAQYQAAKEAGQIVETELYMITDDQGISSTDNKVQQNYSTSTGYYPLLLTDISGVSSTAPRGETGAILNNNIYAMPSEGSLYATTHYGDYMEIGVHATTSYLTVDDDAQISGNLNVDGDIVGGQVFGAVWNDYAEYRETNNIEIEPGRVICENGDDTLSLSKERLQPGANIISDTFGFAIGETSIAKTPVAVCGRVLAYPYEDRDSYLPGDAVCAGPNGTVSKMTREEIREYPDRILGTVSAIPSYEIWGSGKTLVNGRIWIKIK